MLNTTATVSNVLQHVQQQSDNSGTCGCQLPRRKQLTPARSKRFTSAAGDGLELAVPKAEQGRVFLVQQRTVTETVLLSGHSLTRGQMVAAGWEQLVTAVQLAAVTITGSWVMCRIHVKLRCDSCTQALRTQCSAGARCQQQQAVTSRAQNAARKQMSWITRAATWTETNAPPAFGSPPGHRHAHAACHSGSRSTADSRELKPRSCLSTLSTCAIRTGPFGW